MLSQKLFKKKAEEKNATITKEVEICFIAFAFVHTLYRTVTTTFSVIKVDLSNKLNDGYYFMDFYFYNKNKIKKYLMEIAFILALVCTQYLALLMYNLLNQNVSFV